MVDPKSLVTCLKVYGLDSVQIHHVLAKVEALVRSALIGIPGAEKGGVVAWRVRPVGSTRPWTLYDDPKAVEFYRTVQDGGPYEIEPLYAAPTSERVQALEEEMADKLVIAVASAISEAFNTETHAGFLSVHTSNEIARAAYKAFRAALNHKSS